MKGAQVGLTNATEKAVEKAIAKMANSKTTTTVMLPNRTITQVDNEIFSSVKALLDLVQAADGLWLPKCHLAQYEAGNRPPVKVADDDDDYEELRNLCEDAKSHIQKKLRNPCLDYNNDLWYYSMGGGQFIVRHAAHPIGVQGW